MHLFDNSTALIAWAADCFLMAALLLPIALGRRERPYIAWWTTGLLIKGIGLAGIVMTNAINVTGTGALSFGLLSLANILIAMAIVSLCGLRARIAAAASMFVWALMMALLAGRLPAANLLAFASADVILCAFVAIALLRRVPAVGNRRLQLALAAIFAVEGICQMIAIQRISAAPFQATISSMTITIFIVSSFLVFTAKAFLSVALAMSKFQTELQRLASTDPLTGTLNRRGIDDATDRLFGKDARPARIAYFALDLDHFKQINDALGHHTGDLALQHFTDIVRDCLRSEDILGRTGGEEFTILARVKHDSDAFEIAERIRTAVNTSPLELDERKVTMSVSIGLAVGDSSKTVLDKMVTRADKALYTAKTTGRNRSVQLPDYTAPAFSVVEAAS
ncbi:GGDEF domain-containing protein [Martelella alba]|uniref:diguanylate cyclase n=1 Tax=Martelella alba TaxID=2590451 RepID=A0A506UI74_9HYPH|nr:GGDEF domain-containing protein [Martelella alba]TPW33009.1 GGDEF domain-containing protein [Martelella alba]